MSTQPTNDFDYQMASSKTVHTSVFPNANGIRFKNFTANINTPSRPTLEVLYQRVALNAIRNEGGRADDAKCHPGTREEVIGLIERWMDSTEVHRILWICGPAGGGKTAIMKTIIERSTTRDAHIVSFFFFRGDSTRKSAQPLVATLIYQLLQLDSALSEAIAERFSTHPLILGTSITEQCKLISMLAPTIRQSSPNTRIILLIDGLDECDVDAERSQREIVCALERLVMENDSPFRLLVTSRREAHIQMTFNQLPSPARTIFLNDEYLPEKDVWVFVTAEFDKIKVSHPLASSLPKHWPVPSDVENVVKKSSGQFIYAATVMRYISHPSTVPTLSLERVMGIVPPVNNSPFTNLDNIYTFILDRANDEDATRDILSMHMLVMLTPTSMDLLAWYNSRYTKALVESCVSQLSPIVTFYKHGNLRFYHASLDDFLRDRGRSGRYWVDIDAFRAKVLAVLWRKHIIDNTGDVHGDALVGLLSDLQKPTPDITHMLLHAPITRAAYLFRDHYDLLVIMRLYYPDDIQTYKRILRRILFICVLSYSPLRDDDLPEIPHIRECGTFYRRWSWKWWFQLLKHIKSSD